MWKLNYPRIKLLFFCLLFSISTLSMAVAAESDTRALSIGIGNMFGYNLDTGDLGTAQELTIGFGLADNLEAGFHFITGDGVNFASYNLFSLSYAVSQRMGLNIYGGSRTTAPPRGVNLRGCHRTGVLFQPFSAGHSGYHDHGPEAAGGVPDE